MPSIISRVASLTAARPSRYHLLAGLLLGGFLFFLFSLPRRETPNNYPPEGLPCRGGAGGGQAHAAHQKQLLMQYWRMSREQILMQYTPSATNSSSTYQGVHGRFAREGCVEWTVRKGERAQHDMVRNRTLLERLAPQRIMSDARSEGYAKVVSEEMKRDTYGLWRFEKEVLSNSPKHKGLTLLPRSTLKTILDVGANVGMFSIQAALRFPEATIFALEPIPDNFERLVWNICESGVNNVIPLQVAVGNGSASIALQYLIRNPGGSRLREGLSDGEQVIQYIVPQVSLDDIVRLTGVEIFDFGKIDCEGCEIGVVLGHPTPVPMLRSRFRFVGAEFHPGFYKKNPDYPRVQKAFAEAFPSDTKFFSQV